MEISKISAAATLPSTEAVNGLAIALSKKLEGIGEYYFSQKLREIDEMNKAGKQVISLGIGSPDLPPHPEVIKTLQEEAVKTNHMAIKVIRVVRYLEMPSLNGTKNGTTFP